MTDLKTSSNERSQPVPKWFAVSLLAVSLVGFLDSAYLAAKHFFGSPVTCFIVEGCETVTTSRFATVAGIPVALLGAFYYLGIFLLAVAYLDTKRAAFMKLAARLTFVGFLASLWFIYVQAFVLEAWCIYCLVSATRSTILFILSLVFLFVLPVLNARRPIS